MEFISKNIILLFGGLVFVIFFSPAYAECTGCLCPGDPCNLCPLPAMQDSPVKSTEPELCKRIREQVPPTSAQPGSNEYFPSLDRSVAVCVKKEGMWCGIANKPRNFLQDSIVSRLPILKKIKNAMSCNRLTN